MRPASSGPSRTLAATLLGALAACGPTPVAPEAGDEYVDLTANEQALGVTCIGTQECSGGGSVYTSAYRVGATPTSSGELLQTFSATADATPARVFVVARRLRAFTTTGEPMLRARVYGPLTTPVSSIDFDTLTPLLTGQTAVGTLDPSGATGIRLTGGGALELGATYALRLTADGVGAPGTDPVLVGIGAVAAETYPGGAAHRAGRRSSVAWGPLASARFRPAASWPVAFAFSGAPGSPCSAPADCSSGTCSAGECGSASPVIVSNGTGGRNWSDGTYATSCNGYRTPANAQYLYAGATGDGVYTISPAGTPFNVYCDMTTDQGGWTLVMQAIPSTTSALNVCTANAVGTLDLDDTTVSAPAKLSTAAINAVWSTTRELMMKGHNGSSATTRAAWESACILDYKATYAFHTNASAATEGSQLESTTIRCPIGATASYPNVSAVTYAQTCGFYLQAAGGSGPYWIYSADTTFNYAPCAGNAGRTWAASGPNNGCNVSKMFVR